MKPKLALSLAGALLAVGTALPARSAAGLAPAPSDSPLQIALERAARSIDGGDLETARAYVTRALERDRRSIEAWQLRARLAEEAEDTDDLVYARHRIVELAEAADLSSRELEPLREALRAVDPLAGELAHLRERFVDSLLDVAKDYESGDRPHSAIRVYRQVLALAPERADVEAAIDRVARSPDPSLAADAKPKDLLADMSAEEIREFDWEHSTWSDRAELERENYTTHTDAGYEVLVRAAEAMEHMNAFYRRFFRHGTEEHGGSVPSIALLIFKNREEYLEKGSSPAEWSGGQFTGSSVETYIPESGFSGMTGTLFHEAAHQFVGLATNASGWLNEGLASFFEGCRILANGTVRMNEPANHRLRDLVRRMERGWMVDETDGVDPGDPSAVPQTAPTFRIVIENRYTWGPAWYAPTWGVVYFLYNYRDPADGRYVYRDAFYEFIDKSGGRTGEGAVRNFEEIVLANAAEPTPGLEGSDLVLPKTVDELNAVWKEWMLELWDAQSGQRGTKALPYLDWARHAITREDFDVAVEHFEKGLVETPEDPDLLIEFAEFLAGHAENPDRAAKLLRRAVSVLDRAEEPDEERIERCEKSLGRWDPEEESLAEVHEEIGAAMTSLVERYLAAGVPSVAMDLSARIATDFEHAGLWDLYGEAYERRGSPLDIWQLAYNETDLTGWARAGQEFFRPNGRTLIAEFGRYAPGQWTHNFLILDTVTSGDFSLSAEVQANKGEVSLAGLVFGQKSADSFHGLVLFPGRRAGSAAADTGFVDLTSFYAPNEFETWRHTPVDVTTEGSTDGGTGGGWHELRVDIVGKSVDVWFDGEFLATQEFASTGVLRGALGLIVGRGTARFRDVRFLSRPPRDPAARIEREHRMAELGVADESGGPINGSWQGRVPPFPTVHEWVQGERSSWDERGPVPTLFVMWSIHQNDLIPIHRWLRHLAERYGEVGLEIVALASADDQGKVASYLASHPFPGTVAVDARTFAGLGDTFEAYELGRFNLPRVILLDVDHRVAWEGDPGFRIGEAWRTGTESYLDGPLENLVKDRRLRELASWRESWAAGAREAIERGELASAIDVLVAAQEFDPEVSPEVRRARDLHRTLSAAARALETTADAIARQGCEPAVELLVEWAELIGVDVDRDTKRSLRDEISSRNADEWDEVAKDLGKHQRRLDEDNALGVAERLLEDVADREGTLPELLRQRLRGAIEAKDEEAARAAIRTGERMPAVWLVRDYLGW